MGTGELIGSKPAIDLRKAINSCFQLIYKVSVLVINIKLYSVVTN